LANDEIIQGVMKTTKITEHQAVTLTRTSITTAQADAINQVMKANEEVLVGYMFTAILDGRTSPICSFHNGKVYGVDDKSYQPPLHWNCRSTMVPVVKSKEELQLLNSSNIKARNLNNIDPLELTGEPSKIKDYSSWLRRQATAIQVKMLGGERQAALFQRGDLKASEFVSPLGKALSIRGLMRRANATVTRPTADNESIISLGFTTPDELMASKTHTAALRAHFKNDVTDNSQALALTDFKGNSLSQKQGSRRSFKSNREGAVFNAEGADYTSGAGRHIQIQEPDILVERLAKVAESTVLTSPQKDYIDKFVKDLGRDVSINQRSVITDVLRQTFTRYNTSGEVWGKPTSVFRKFTLNSVQDLGTLMFNRSADRGKLFGNLTTALSDDPEVFIFGKKYTISEIIDSQISDNRYIETWQGTYGDKLANSAYYNAKAPLAAYTQPIIKRYLSVKELKKKLITAIPGVKTKRKIDKFFDPSDSWVTQQISTFRGISREILDREFLFAFQRSKAKAALKDKITKATSNAMKSIATADGADYDMLAIKIGQGFDKELGDLNPFRSKSLQDFHKDGSRIIDSLEKQGMIRTTVIRDIGTSSPIDINTGRPIGNKALRGVNVTRQIGIINGPMKDLQIATEKARIARRFGYSDARNKVYAKAGSKEFYDARDRKTTMPVVSDKVYADYDPKQIDRGMAQMLNHANSVRYEVDPEFFDFVERLIYFSDKRGEAEKWDSVNEMKKLFMSRGNDSRGTLATAKYYRKRNESFSVDVSIDFRGRVYHRGLLTPTKGEAVRPFLNTARSVAMTPDTVEELQTQIGALIGNPLDTLTVKGRLNSFKAEEKNLLEIGELMMSNTQPDRRIKDFLSNPLVAATEDVEVGKLARLALEYTRVYRHMEGNVPINKGLYNPSMVSRLQEYQTKMMIENDASSSGAQIISLSTGDRAAGELSNVLQTASKQRLYDEIAKRTVDDPEFLAIPELQGLDLDWTDLMKAAKNQNMVAFYGAGDATKAANVANQFAKVLAKKGKIAISTKEVDKFKAAIDAKISFEMDRKNWARIDELRDLKQKIVLSSKEGRTITDSLYETARAEFRDGVKNSEEMHTFLIKLTDETGDLVGTRLFETISKIMSRQLEAEVPVTGKFIRFWKDIAKDYVAESGSVDIPWVTFDGKTMVQRYRVKEQTRIDFTDPITGEKVFNIYEAPSKDGKLLSQQSIQDASIGLGVNGNHSNDAVIVRRFHLWGLKNNVDTGTIHDAFFTNLGEAVNAKSALRQIYADALQQGTIKQTLKAMRDSGMSRATYDRYLQRAYADGLIDPVNKITPKELLEPFRDGNDWYGIGP
jgi:SPP1 gp7 family putative phage head morphogenesis protein